MNVPLGDSAGVRLALDGERRDGFVNSNFGPALDSDTHFGGRLSLRVNPTDWLENLTVAEGYTFDSIGQYSYPTRLGPGVRPILWRMAQFFDEAQANGPFDMGSNAWAMTGARCPITHSGVGRLPTSPTSMSARF